MTTIHPVPRDYPSEIIGYAQPWIVSPGELVDIKVSCTEPKYTHRTVRLIQGHEGPHAPRYGEEEITRIPPGTGKGRFQLAHPGSYAIVEDIETSPEDIGLKISLHIQPYLPESGHPQTLISSLDVAAKSGLAIVLGEQGEVEFWVGTGNEIEVVRSEFMLVKKRWTAIEVTVSKASLEARITPIVQVVEATKPPKSIQFQLKADIVLSPISRFTVAGGYAQSNDTESSRVTNFYNGRVDSPSIETTGSNARVLAKWDFAKKVSSDNIIDVSGAERHGYLVNAPTRALKDHDWDGSEPDWTKAPYGYGAIHFHEDDLDDACWETDFTIKIPEDARSGAYAVEIKAAEGVLDMATFFVRPSKATTAKIGAKVALVLSTFTYLAYANEHLFDANSPAHLEVPDQNVSIRKDENYFKMDRRRDLGLSMYDVHKDHTGVVFSSSKRPILNVRPGYVHWAMHRPREFSADLLMIGFLERSGIPYDICLDHDLHSMGAEALSAYTTVMTGCHPEYPSTQSYNAYTDYAKRGGNLMYLGGNGFYWVSATDPARPHRIEVRRGEQGVRTSYQEPGERIHSLTGQQGGLWRGRGRAANYLFGIGCCGEGTGSGVPYRRTKDFATTHPHLVWMFEGIPEDELVGINGFGGGASGDEIDRMDHAYGSPLNAVVVASSTGHSDEFGLFPEDVGFPMIKTLGTQTDLIRSDIVYYETSAGGAVFSVGSINWYCSLGWDDYENNVARLTGNVLREFAKGTRR